MSLCTAALLTIGLNILSPHSNHEGVKETFTPGAYVNYDNWAGGVVSNSSGKPSLWAGKVFESASCRYDLILGGVTGYDKETSLADAEGKSFDLGRALKGIRPFVAVAVKFDTSEVIDNSRVRITVLPHIRNEWKTRTYKAEDGTVKTQNYNNKVRLQGVVFQIAFEKSF